MALFVRLSVWALPLRGTFGELRFLPHCRAAALLLSLAALGGCLGASSSSSYETGRQVTGSTLDKIEIGTTTENWLLGALGEPTSRQVVAEGTEVRDQRSEVSGQGSEVSDQRSAISDQQESPLPLREGQGEGDSALPGPRPAERTGVVEILRYDWSRREESGGAFFLIFAGSETKTERSSAWFELNDGVVTDYGVE